MHRRAFVATGALAQSKRVHLSFYVYAYTARPRGAHMSENQAKDGNVVAQEAIGVSNGAADKNGHDFSDIRDENDLRLMFARDAIQLARVPGRAPDRMSKGISEGERCVVCEMSIKKDTLGYKVEFTQNSRNFVRYHLHNQCFAAWEYACEKVEIAGNKPNGQGARANDKTPENGRNPDPGKGGV